MKWRIFIKYKTEHDFKISTEDLETAIESANYWINKTKNAKDSKEENNSIRMLKDFLDLFERPDCFVIEDKKSQEMKKEIDFQQIPHGLSAPPNLNADFIIVDNYKYMVNDVTLDFDKSVVEFNVNSSSIEKKKYERRKKEIMDILKEHIDKINTILRK